MALEPEHQIVNKASDFSLVLVEDSQDDAFFFRRVLGKTRIQCEFRHVWNGYEAMELLKNGGNSSLPDLVFLDLKMPHVNGFEVLSWLKNRTFSRKFDVIVLSGSDDRGDRLRAVQLGAADYLVKPISQTQLKTILERFGTHPAAAESSKGTSI